MGLTQVDNLNQTDGAVFWGELTSECINFQLFERLAVPSSLPFQLHFKISSELLSPNKYLQIGALFYQHILF